MRRAPPDYRKVRQINPTCRSSIAPKISPIIKKGGADFAGNTAKGSVLTTYSPGMMANASLRGAD